MNPISGRIQNGEVVLDEIPNWPNGTTVTVKPSSPAGADELPDDNDDSPEAIARRIALMDRVQPWMTTEELAEWERVRAEDKAFQLSQWEKWSKECGGAFE